MSSFVNSGTSKAKERLAESALYALLRRLSPALGHHVLGALQPLSIISLLLDNRLQLPNPELALLARNISQLQTSIKDATNSFISLMTWIAPNDNEMVRVAAGVQEATALVATELSNKGFTIANQIGDIDLELQRCLMRTVFLMALMTLIDASKAPAIVVLSAHCEHNEFEITISIQPVKGEPPPSYHQTYRYLEWEDVQALAEIKAVKITRTSQSAKLRFPLAAIN